MGSDQGKSNNDDDRSAMAKAMDKVSLIFAACGGLILPVLIGYFFDQFLGTTLILTLIGMVIGFFAGGWMLFKLVKKME